MIGKNILKALKIKGIPQNKAAKDLGISPSRLNQYIKESREPDLKIILLLCDYLKITPNYLFGFENADTPPLQFTNKKDIIEIYLILEKWLSNNDCCLEPADKINLVFALYDRLIQKPKENWKDNIIELSDFFIKMKKAR